MTFRISADEGQNVAATAVKQIGAQLRRFPKPPPLFLWIVVIPGILAGIYWFLIASPIYVSEAKFIVRAPSSVPTASGGGLATILQGVGLSPAETDSFIVSDYATSHDAIAQLDARFHLRDMLGRPGSDFLTRFPHPFEPDTFEKLEEEYPRFVSVDYNSTSGITTLSVKAFRAQDAQVVASALLDGGEELINRLNQRAEQDAITETHREITEAEGQLGDAEKSLTEFRNRERLIDPTRSSTVSLELLGKLESDLATLKAERAGIAASAPQSPELPTLDNRIRAYEQQAQAQQAQMAGQTGSLAPMIGEYERLSLERDFAGKTVAAAAEAAETARLDARRKRLYLERISNPSLADGPTEPHRTASFITAIVSLLLIYGVISLMLAGLREHQQR